MDLDITSTGLHRAFNLPPDLRLPLDTAAERILPLEIDGIKLFCLAWKLTEDACVGWREEGRDATVLGGSGTSLLSLTAVYHCPVYIWEGRR